MTTATDNEYNKIGTQVFKIDEILKVIEVGNHIQCQSQHYFLVDRYARQGWRDRRHHEDYSSEP